MDKGKNPLILAIGSLCARWAIAPNDYAYYEMLNEVVQGQPAGVPRGNWIQAIPGKGWFVLLRLYGPLEPFFDKSWQPGEIELVP